MPYLTWLGDAEARQAARRVPYRILQPAETVGDAAAENLLIQGDNLEALKALLPFYAGRVKCAYIDPPYNTRSAFEHYDDNLEHSQWLSLMYPRMELLRDLLADNGSVWISIDDAEGHYLKVLADEVFGRSQFVTTIAWQQRTTRENRKVFSSNFEYVLVYAKEAEKFSSTRNEEELSETVKGRYKKVVSRRWWKFRDGVVSKIEFETNHGVTSAGETTPCETVPWDRRICSREASGSIRSSNRCAAGCASFCRS